MPPRKRYRVTVDGGSYTCDLNHQEIEALRRRHHQFVSVEPLELEQTINYNRLAEQIRKDAHDETYW